MNDVVLEAKQLCRYYGQKCAVRDVSFSVPRGSVFAFVGRNGSGKTTLLRLVLGLLDPTRGSSTILGQDSQKLSSDDRARIGYLPEGHPLYDWMRIDECIAFQRAFYPRWKESIVDAVVDHFRLSPSARVGTLSRGERAGFALGLCLATDPELLVLDEPALGLDPVARRMLLESMVYLTRAQDRTVVFTSHQIADVERVADHIALLDRGVLRACAPLEVFRDDVQRFVLSFSGVLPTLPSIPGLLTATSLGQELSITLSRVTPESEAALHALGADRVKRVSLALEDALVAFLSEERMGRSFLDRIGGAS